MIEGGLQTNWSLLWVYENIVSPGFDVDHVWWGLKAGWCFCPEIVDFSHQPAPAASHNEFSKPCCSRPQWWRVQSLCPELFLAVELLSGMPASRLKLRFQRDLKRQRRVVLWHGSKCKLPGFTFAPSASNKGLCFRSLAAVFVQKYAACSCSRGGIDDLAERRRLC